MYVIEGYFICFFNQFLWMESNSSIRSSSQRWKAEMQCEIAWSFFWSSLLLIPLSARYFFISDIFSGLTSFTSTWMRCSKNFGSFMIFIQVFQHISWGSKGSMIIKPTAEQTTTTKGDGFRLLFTSRKLHESRVFKICDLFYIFQKNYQSISAKSWKRKKR